MAAETARGLDCSVVLVELSGGALPFAATFSSAISLPVEQIYYTCSGDDEMAVATTNFPLGCHLGSLWDIQSSTIEALVGLHPRSLFCVTYGGACLSAKVASRLLQTLVSLLELASSVVWLVGAMDDVDNLFVLLDLPHANFFTLQSARACPIPL